MSKAVVVNEETCIGCGLCVQLCPKVFAMQDNGKSKAIDSAGDEEANIQGAIDACPVQAISWTE
ncbi:ferredoxin [Patescibacteria group bacterium]